VIVSLHVATGGAAGALVRTRGRALIAGLVLHALGDRMPHWDIDDRRFEIVSGLALVGAFALRTGAASSVVVGALASSAPDIEHVIRLPRPGGRKLFPSHRVPGWHRAGGAPAWAQLLVAGVLAGVVLSRR
jgi:hypothetical protein